MSADALVKVFACLGVQDGQGVDNANNAVIPTGNFNDDKHKGCQHKRPKRLSVFSAPLSSIRYDHVNYCPTDQVSTWCILLCQWTENTWISPCLRPVLFSLWIKNFFWHSLPIGGIRHHSRNNRKWHVTLKPMQSIGLRQTSFHWVVNK